MLIENPDVFKTWLTSILEPLCDADPAALAKYVYALVKKDKPIDELRDGMLDQLDVFLQSETKPFVEQLFVALETQDYLQQKLASPVPVEEPHQQLDNNNVENHEPGPATNGFTEEPTERPRSPSAPAALKHRVVLNRAPPAAKHAAPRPLHNDQTLAKLVPLNELLEEPLDQLPRRRDRRTESLKDKDDRRRRRSRSRSWDRTRRVRRHQPVWRNSSPPARRRATSRSPSLQPRRYRNRSPPAVALAARTSRSRSRSPMAVDGARERPRERQRSRDRELDRDRISRDRDHRERVSRERERGSRERERVSRDRERDRDRERSRDRSRGSAGTPTQEGARSPTEFPHRFNKRRCRDFDEKGYCMRGDLCQWDHGTDPVVLEDAALSRVLTMAPPVPEYNPLAPDIWVGAPPAMPGFAPFPPPIRPPRELIPIPSRLHGMAGPRPGPLGPHPLGHPMHQHRPHYPKKQFDYSRLGGIRPGGPNCSLEVKKVPLGMNDITHLNNHFGKFGRIVNIQVCFEGDPEAALITFSSHTEANVAYKSTEAVLNNRFIKVFWHNPESKQENVPPSGTNPSGNKTSPPAAPAPPHVNPPSHAGSHNKVLINKDNMKATADNKVAAANAAAAAASEKLKDAGTKMEAEVIPTPAQDKQKLVQDMRKRAHTLLETQLAQQKLLIEKLEKGDVTAAQRNALMEAIKTAQEGIEKLRKELLTYPKMVQAQGNAVVKKLKTREELQKEILDMELDIFSKQQESQDVSEQLKKLGELRKKLALLSYPAHVPRRPIPSRGGRFGGNSRYSLRAGPGSNQAHQATTFNNQSVDHRPRALLVSGFESDEIEAVVRHFAQYGEIVSREVNAAVPEVTLQYKARAQAEIAAARAKHFNERTLSITWTTSNKPSPAPAAAEPTEPAPPGEVDPLPPGKEPEVVVEEETLLQDDEDDDEYEERSWRR